MRVHKPTADGLIPAQKSSHHEELVNSVVDIAMDHLLPSSPAIEAIRGVHRAIETLEVIERQLRERNGLSRFLFVEAHTLHCEGRLAGTPCGLPVLEHHEGRLHLVHREGGRVNLLGEALDRMTPLTSLPTKTDIAWRETLDPNLCGRLRAAASSAADPAWAEIELSRAIEKVFRLFP
jgi:hypothetical protein